MKNHEIGQMHNELRRIANIYFHTGQLRARLVSVVRPLVDENKTLQAEVGILKDRLSEAQDQVNSLLDRGV